MWSTYVGGDQHDGINGITIDSINRIYISGVTYSLNWINGGFDTEYSGDEDAFLMEMSSDGNPLWSTYLGGVGEDIIKACSVDITGNIYVAGGTESADWMTGEIQNTNKGKEDAFVARIAPGGARLVWAADMGGTQNDHANVLTQDEAGNLYVCGYTYSPGWMSGIYDIYLDGNSDAFLAKVVDKLGALRVTFAPPEVEAAGARWRRARTTDWLAGGTVETQLPAGEYEIEVTEIPHWVHPAHPVANVVRETTTTTVVTYAPDVGALTVTIAPPEAVAEGARWRPVGTADWLESGATVTGLPSGEYRVEFGPVAGWDRPVDRDCVVKFNQTTSITAYYAPSGLNAADPRAWTLYE
ncbi:MAG: SBBP repeat-containing protein [bacterium]|nr:SBBP repeat-containing protein [bacterium]